MDSNLRSAREEIEKSWYPVGVQLILYGFARPREKDILLRIQEWYSPEWRQKRCLALAAGCRDWLAGAPG
jgi:hypothetical protein